MATNLVLMKESEEVLRLSEKLGFDKTLFLEKELVLVGGKDKKEILKKIREAKKKDKLVVVRAETEEILRLVVEKTPAEIVFGQELINREDSLHFRRGGLDQIICKIAAEKGKIIGFSFGELLKAEGGGRSKLLGRMIFNLGLCKKYRVGVFFGNFSEEKWEMRSARDLKTFLEVLGGGLEKGFDTLGIPLV